MPDSVSGAALDWITAEGTARVIFTKTMGVIWMNVCAKDILSANEVLGEKDGAIVGHVSNAVEDLQQLACESENGHPATGFIRTNDRIELVIRVDALGQSEFGQIYGAILNVYPIDFRDRGDALGRILGLTKTEQSIVVEMLGGAAVERIARNSETTVPTVRTHIRNIYAKLDISSREALFARVLPLCI